MTARVPLARPAFAHARFGAATLSRLRGRSRSGVAKARFAGEGTKPCRRSDDFVYCFAGR